MLLCAYCRCACTCERVQHGGTLEAEQLDDTVGQLFRKHGRMLVVRHIAFGGDAPSGIDPCLELLGVDVSIFCPACHLERCLAENLYELPGVFQVWAARALPTAPCGVLAVVVVLLPEYLALPDQLALQEVIADYVMARDVVREQRLHIDRYPAARLQHADALIEDGEQLVEVILPSEIVRRRAILEPEVVRR